MLSLSIKNTANLLAEANAGGEPISMHMRESIVEIMRSWEERVRALENADPSELRVYHPEETPRPTRPHFKPTVVAGTDVDGVAQPAQEAKPCA